jgi:hypothetical protein
LKVIAKLGQSNEEGEKSPRLLLPDNHISKEVSADGSSLLLNAMNKPVGQHDQCLKSSKNIETKAGSTLLTTYSSR